MPLVINSLAGGDTHARIQIFADRSNSKKPGMRQPVADAPGLKRNPIKSAELLM